MSTRIIELQIDPANGLGVDIISIVSNPAIEVNFQVFNAQAPMPHRLELATANAEKRIITGPALIPNKFIYRRDDFSGEPYYVYFTKKTVSEISESYLKEMKQRNVNLEHDMPVSDVTLIESWIVSDPNLDKSKALGYNLPEGSWMVSMKVDNDQIWDDIIKTGMAKGFSIEGYFISKFSKPAKKA